ncbi:unnamed protein product [Coregonus sp. 'balchen']|uniref:C2HC/C3H-type domain-containing protein n=1 Tax=Coregonus suidteri TaxID=861788 RepID=A0AAN8RAR6_9TELE|nr:unnamed protein product [Coregonus sp. 'balchen']
MEPPESYEELLREYLKLREEKEQMNQVIIWMTKRNSQLEDLCSQHGLSIATSVQQKAKFSPHSPSRLPVPPTAVPRASKVWLESSSKTKLAAMIEKVDKVTLNPVQEKKRCEVVEAKQQGGLQLSMSVADSNRKECDICGRRFHPDRLEKHSLICAKVASESKRRGVYDSFKHRYKGTNLDSFIKRPIDP